jgi:hypothetical protein
MLTLDLVTFDTRDWKVHTHEPTVRSWNVGGDALRFRLAAGPCLEITIEGWRARAERETTAQGGTWISFDEASVDGCLGFRGIFKFPAAKVGFPPDSLAVYIVGMIAVPLGDTHLLLNTEAVEKGTTGQREAAFALTQPRPSGEPQGLSRSEDFFDRVRLGLGRRLPSDVAEADALAPTHPLSRVRAYQRMLLLDLRLAPGLKALALPARI